MYFALKILFSAFIIALVTQLADSLPKVGALIKSLPITSLIVFIIMKYEGSSDQQIATMSWDILFMVIPSLILFVVIPVMINRGFTFYPSLIAATVVTGICYLVSFKLLN